MAIYTYRVLRVLEDGEAIPEGATVYIDCGNHKAKMPDGAGLAAAEEIGKTGSYREVSLRHFNETEVVPTTGFAIGDRDSAEQPVGDPPIPDVLPCETEGCGHLPAEHGAGGLGICRVDGCPCGKYESAP